MVIQPISTILWCLYHIFSPNLNIDIIQYMIGFIPVKSRWYSDKWWLYTHYLACSQEQGAIKTCYKVINLPVVSSNQWLNWTIGTTNGYFTQIQVMASYSCFVPLYPHMMLILPPPLWTLDTAARVINQLGCQKSTLNHHFCWWNVVQLPYFLW